MIQPQFETYRYVGEICQVNSQSMVECRLPGSEVNSILAIHAHAVPGETGCSNGEAQYAGKVLFCILYEDGNKKICRIERGVEFFHKAEQSEITPSCFSKTSLRTENVSWRREGSGIYVTAVVDATIVVYGAKQIEYLMDGEGLIVKKQDQKIYKSISVSGEMEGEDEFDTDYVGDVLLHDEHAIVTRVRASDGQIDVEGELNVHVCVLKKEDVVCSYERILPFKVSIPSEEAYGEMVAGARIFVKSAELTADVDEEKGVARILLSYVLSAECVLTIVETLSVTEDAFSTTASVDLKKHEEGGMYLLNQIKCVERVHGDAILSPEVEGSMQAVVLPRAEITIKKGEKGMEAEGVVLAEGIFRASEGAYRSATISIPVLFPVDVEGMEADVDCAVSGFIVKRKKDGQIEGECLLKLSIRAYERRDWAYVAQIEMGEAIQEDEYGFSIFMTETGEELWQVAKRIRCAPEELKKSNPDLKFPLRGGERLYVYRRIK